MNAFLVIVLLIGTADGTPVMEEQLYLPRASMEDCIEYLKDPAPIEWHLSHLKVLRYKFGCMPRITEAGV